MIHLPSLILGFTIGLISLPTYINTELYILRRRQKNSDTR